MTYFVLTKSISHYDIVDLFPFQSTEEIALIAGPYIYIGI